jgi:uncharacterized membrane protein YqiK
MIEQIPQLAETAAKAIANIKFDKVVVWEGGNATATAARWAARPASSRTSRARCRR